MKTIIRTIAQYIANLVKVAWYELNGKTVARHVVKTVFKALNGTIWEITASVKANEVVKSSVAIQGLLFNL